MELINAIAGTKIQGSTTPWWEKGGCLYSLFDSCDNAADTTRESYKGKLLTKATVNTSTQALLQV